MAFFEKPLTGKEIFSIPNIMGYFRILLIPVYVLLYYHAESVREYYIAAVLVGISGITDMLDGKVARHFNMITELGKALDPVADKLTLGAMILCLAFRYENMRWLVGVFVLKEGFMGIMGLLLSHYRSRKLDGAKWYGKVCTAFSYVVMFVLFFFLRLPLSLVNGLIVCCGVLMAVTWVLYVPVFVKMWKEK
ncbi:CDP-alcohol phosphatidyltransferase family protein [Blautia marasmi]|uniref:CDP-alcohol phosphatidyltransferase family protein n=1 Tax=Blautia marasmi TaxID=1917868 RepID=UPI00266D2391|nr:CDP-alcohol phosphatidyltransferase family protein [Blautia marasmi]